jgi:hypothetical protein
VVGINVQVAVGLYVEINQTVPCDLVEHMVKKGQSRRELPRPRSIQSNGHLNLRLGCVTRYLCLSHACNDTVAR